MRTPKLLKPDTMVVPSAKANADVRVWLDRGGKVVEDDGWITKVQPTGSTTVVWCERAHVKVRKGN